MSRLAAVFLLAFLSTCATAPAFGRWSEKYADASPAIKQWFKNQHNANGQWCCDESDGERFDGAYDFNDDGSVNLYLTGGKKTLPAYMVLKTANPTGRAIWWHTGETSYCFAPGALM